MKKIIFFLILLSFGMIYAKSFTNTQKFDTNSIRDLSISLKYENLYISNAKGNEIFITIEANSQELFPEIIIQDDCFAVKTVADKPSANFLCDVNIFIPGNCDLNSLLIENNAGKINIENTSARLIKIKTEGLNNYINLNADSFELNDMGDSNSIIKNLNCNYFKINRFMGKTLLSLKHPPLIESSIRAKNGEIEVSLEENENYSFFVKSFNSKLINRFNNTEAAYIRDGKNIVQNKGSSFINIQTHTGNIILTRG